MYTDNKNKHIPKISIQRLAVYLQVLESLDVDGVEVITSEPLAKACDVNASQIRKDLTYFGEFGVRGVGYNVKSLMASISEALGINREWPTVLVGAGNLGRSLVGHNGFKQTRFKIVGVFDCDPFKIGEEIAGLEVVCTQRLKEKIADLKVEIGIIATPPERAQRAANHLVSAGIKGILNFAPARIFVPTYVNVEYVDYFHYLYSLAFQITHDKR
ncbi:redox-sensing transcriptional repressor Rex [Desulfovibrio litoralis]|uniref:Redox-sensing transcriptional repressor Rex n=1 Tax=Desulfovibrio litoralis DSM 11393 TaxID=1121455 RepID=A0A1M7S7X4_9BACT|nr:redox-sensing transcriptional repressor Rex [Desulfovibrio litoralis]SHN54530.1 redox-sensing transcriptional repressor [Desulfovibrio litoralis DSM 11393]